jgi:ankyrin repeat protein
MRDIFGVCLCMVLSFAANVAQGAKSDPVAEIDDLSTDAAIEKEYDRWSYVKEGRKYCAVHKVLLQEDSVPILFGDYFYPPYYLEAYSRTFPNAETEYIMTFGGDWDSPEKEKVWYCPKCRHVKSEWIARRHAKHKARLLRLIEETPATKLTGEDGTDFLSNAAASGYLDIVGMLLRKGAPVDRSDSSGGGPLHAAAGADQLQAVKALLEAGANVNARDFYGRTALHEAAWFASKAVVAALVEAGADINVEDSDGESPGTTPLWLACNFNLRHRDVAPYLEKVGAIYDAAFMRRIEQCSHIDVKGDDGRSLLHEAASEGGYSALKLLIKKGGNVKAKDTYGCTALHCSVWGRNPRLVKLLADAGADVDAQDESGETALHLAATQGTIGIARELVANGADVNIRNDIQQTALHNAAGGLGHPEIVKLLLAGGAELEVRESLFGRTALHEADWKVSKLLIDAGADLNPKDDYGETPLFHSTRLAFLNVVELLLEAGADVNVVNNTGQTALDVANLEGHKRVAALLQKYGGKPSKQ